jgi:hypothetical protein
MGLDGIARFTERVAIVAERRAARPDGLLQNAGDVSGQAAEVFSA